jgi:copper chaperone CopZ
MEQTTFQVRGMHCAACAHRIQQALSRLAGVKRSRADHRRGEVRVVFDPARTSEAVVRACLEQAGYEVCGVVGAGGGTP